MESATKPCLVISLLLFLLLVSTVDGTKLADAKDKGEQITLRTGAAGHGHSLSSHSGHVPNGGTPEQGGAGVVDPRNQPGRSHHHRGAASRALGCSSLATSVFLGAILAVFVV
ncbi:hypothetical protein ACP70R_048125 [Stipagrostis hirtigluma subsp. patula]